MFLAHYTGSGIDGVLDLCTDDFFEYLDEALELYKAELTASRRVVLVGIEK